MTTSRTPLLTLCLALCVAFGAMACSDDPKPTPTPTPEPEPDPNPDMPCPEGSVGCPCAEGDVCDGSLVCEMGTCREVDDMNLAISNPDARSCDISITESTAKVLGATFADGVKGKLLRREPNVALSFFRQADEGFPAGSITLQVEGPDNGFAIRSVTCYDRAGGPLDNIEVSF